MRAIYNLLLILCTIFFITSCQEDMDLQGSNGTGYLLLTVSGSNETTTRAANLEGYTGRQIAVEVINDKDVVVEKTDDWENWEDEPIELPVGKYTIKAHSYGFDGKQSAMAAPYYYGAKTVNIEKDKKLQETITCKLANVKMSVKIADELKEAFKSFTIYVTSKEAGKCDPIYFNIDLSAAAIKDTAYFPVTDLVVKYAATNQNDQKNEATKELTGVKGNDHYILNFTLGKAENGSGNVKVDVDETLNTYTYTFTVSQTPTNGAQLSANAWAKFAYLKAENVTATSGMDLTQLKLQYRQKDSKDWVDLDTKSNEKVYTATASGLTPNTTYLYRLTNGGDFKSDSLEFVTEDATALYNGGFEDWYMHNEKIWYAVDKDDFDSKTSTAFWDSGNKGASLMSKNPTSPEESVIHTGNGSTKSTKLQSQFVGFGSLGQFAAGNLYTGHFVKTIGMSGAEIQFGSPFTTRPTQLHGYFQYTAGTVDYYGSNTPDDALVKKDGTDMNSIYIALSDADTPYTVNTKEGTFVDFANDPNIIAYGELPVSECKTTNGWKEFTIDLAYRELTRKPKYIILVCSASKYGDYFTGSSGSVMYIDDFELVYGDTPVVEEKTK